MRFFLLKAFFVFSFLGLSVPCFASVAYVEDEASTSSTPCDLKEKLFSTSFEERIEYLLFLKENSDQYICALRFLEEAENSAFNAELELKLDPEWKGRITLGFYSLLGGGEDCFSDVQITSLYRWFLWIENPNSYRFPIMVCFLPNWDASSSLKTALGKLLADYNLEWSRKENLGFTFLNLSEKG